jgi:hypothetical protein
VFEVTGLAILAGDRPASMQAEVTLSLGDQSTTISLMVPMDDILRRQVDALGQMVRDRLADGVRAAIGPVPAAS